MAPRNLVNLDGVGKDYAARTILHGVSLGVAAGERIGVVGRNGDGKSTLLRLIARREQPDEGLVTHAGDLRLALLSQRDELDPADTIRAALVGERPDHEWAGDGRVRSMLDGLLGGVSHSRFAQGIDTPVAALSGGERRRVALAKALLDDPELLLLDEPTNHLDVEGVAWLAAHLAARRGALVVITHDRWFLDAVCQATWEVADRTVHRYEGGYAAYVLARAERERVEATREARRRQLLRKELAWLRRGPPARSSKPRFRIEAANALIADEPEARDRAELLRFATARLGKTVLELEDVTARVGERTLLRRATWRLGPGDRVAVVGVNGSGKTTLMRMLAGERAPDEGRLVRGQTVRLAHLSQEMVELPDDLRVLEAVEQVRRRTRLGDGRELTAGMMCERFGFGGPRGRQPVGDLSGGERRRLQLMRLLMDEPNVLLLDEPTNDLDIDTLTALEDLLDAWPGTLVAVSHDRYFVERVCDNVYALPGDGSIRHLPGGIDEYLRLRRRDAAAPAPTPTRATAAAAPSDSPGLSGAERRAAQKEAASIERRLDRLSGEIQGLHQRMADHDQSDYVGLQELTEELRRFEGETAVLEERWMELSELVG